MKDFIFAAPGIEIFGIENIFLLSSDGIET